jgi:hypothetical protein
MLQLQRGKKVQNVEDRRSVEEDLEQDLPDRLHVPEPHVERGEQHREAAREAAERHQQQRQGEPLHTRLHARGEHEHEHGEQVQQQVEVGDQEHRERHHQPWELDFAHQVLAVGHRRDRPARGVGEKGEEDDSREQNRRVEADARAEPHELGEDDVEDAEQKQRPHQLPQVAEHRPEEAQLELHDGERHREVDQSAEIAS